MSFILFPNQLFEINYIPKKYLNYKFYLIEHNKFYGKKCNMNFNKKKIILHKASCLAYIDNVKEKLSIMYTSTYPVIKNGDVIMFDIVDKSIEKEVEKFYKKLKSNVTILESPNFMSDRIDLNNFYNKSNSQRITHSSFYKYQLSLHNIPYIKKSYDEENRKFIPIDVNLPNMPRKNDNKYIQKAFKFTKKNFNSN